VDFLTYEDDVWQGYNLSCRAALAALDRTLREKSGSCPASSMIADKSSERAKNRSRSSSDCRRSASSLTQVCTAFARASADLCLSACALARPLRQAEIDHRPLDGQVDGSAGHWRRLPGC
jgi:hypothetical protein